MNINSVVRGTFGKTDSYKKENKIEKSYVDKYKSSKNKDTVEISCKAYKAEQQEQLTASSGKDILGISKGDKENTYIIHFTDSAIVSRAVSRGYITVNGIDIELSDNTKQKLLETDKQAETNRMRAYNEYVMQHELAVAQQQSETWKTAAEDASKAFAIAAKLSRGGKITSAEAQKLMKFNPQLYAMAMSTAAMAKRHRKQENTKTVENDVDRDMTESKREGVEWSQFEWKTYETQMTVSLDGKSPC